mmetsp:Transcript_25483/g.25915  ORF Transcript_25483/g.25915 Transcript_25483/m.25915 type:complete len:86 (+) Transcript_25483:187-444(+)
MKEATHRLTEEQLETFARDGVLVVPNVLSPNQVTHSLDKLHESLANHGYHPHHGGDNEIPSEPKRVSWVWVWGINSGRYKKNIIL